MKYDYSSNNNSECQTVVLDRGDYTSCTVNLHGSTITSWRINNKEMLFVSREAHFTGLSHIRGGIQFVFPAIGEWEFGPRQGFARALPWTLLEGPTKLEGGDIYVVTSLSDNPYTWSLWNYRFFIHTKITLYEKKMAFRIAVENCCPNFPFEFKLMQHSLFKVSNVENCEIIGFKNCICNDLRNSNNKVLVEDREIVTISGHIDRLYLNTPNEVVLHNTVNGGSLKFTKKFINDVNVWNPWIEQSLRMHDLGNDEYRNFIAIEAGMVSRTMKIEPLTGWAAVQVLEYFEPKEQKMVTDIYDCFNDYC